MLTTMREVKMAGYWPNSIFSAIFMERMEVAASKNVKKKTRRIFCDLDRTSFVGKVFIT